LRGSPRAARRWDRRSPVRCPPAPEWLWLWSHRPADWDSIRLPGIDFPLTMQPSTSPVLKDLVLVGGGHSHVAVLKRFGMRPVPGLRLTLIARDVHTPYSGMLPGYIAGRYDYDQCHIDLGRLARFAGARLLHSEVEGVDLDDRRVICGDRPPVPYDLLSINTGSRPNTLKVPGAAEWAVPVKPIDRFLVRWDALVRRVLAHPGRFRVAVVGGGAGGVELARRLYDIFAWQIDFRRDIRPQDSYRVLVDEVWRDGQFERFQPDCLPR